jgi:hypothetical protein
MAEPVAINPAGAELIALAVAVRDDWTERDIRAAIAAAQSAGLTWPQVLVALPRLMADPKARPRELVPDSRSPLAARPRIDEGRMHEIAAEARAALQGDPND